MIQQMAATHKISELQFLALFLSIDEELKEDSGAQGSSVDQRQRRHRSLLINAL